MKHLSKSHQSLSTLKYLQFMCITLQQEPPWIMLILGDTSKQNQPIPEYSETFTEFVCSLSKGKHPPYPNFRWSVYTKATSPCAFWNIYKYTYDPSRGPAPDMLILGAKVKQNQPIPELSDTFTKFVCSPSKRKHPVYPYFRCSVWTKATCPREPWNLHHLSLYPLKRTILELS